MMGWRNAVAATTGKRWIILLVVGALTAATFTTASRVRFNNKLDIWFLKDDPHLADYQAFLERFQADKLAVVGLVTDDIFTAKGLHSLDRITRRIEELDQVHRVRSLTNARVFRGEEGTIRIAPLVKKLPRTKEESDAIRAWALNNPLLTGVLVASDGKAAAIVVELDRKTTSIEAVQRVVGDLRSIVEKEKVGAIQIHLGGAPVFESAFNEINKQDMQILTPLTIGLILLLLYLVFRRVLIALIPLIVVFVSLIWTFGLMGALGVQLTTISSPLNGVIIAVGVADSVHVLGEYYRRMQQGETHRDAIVNSVTHLLGPCFITSLTTIIGMLSLLVSQVRPIREFAIFSSIGVASALLLSVTLVPALLSFIPAPKPHHLERRRGGVLAWLLGNLSSPTRRRSVIVVLTVVPLLVAAGWAIPKIQVGNPGIRMIDADSPVRRDIEVIDARLGGANALEVIIKTAEGGLKAPDLLARIDHLERQIEKHPGVTSARSIVDSLKELNRVLHEGKKDQYRLPTSQEAVAQYYLLYEGEDDFKKLVQSNYSVGRMTIRYREAVVPGEDVKRIGRVEEALKAALPDGVTATATGTMELGVRSADYLTDSMIESFLLAFAMVTIIMLFMLRSVRLTLFAMIPNLIPIFLGLGFMSLLKISLNPGTVMIASIILGIVVDDTVHFLFRLKHQTDQGADIESGIAATVTEAGRPIIITSLALFAGFAVWTFASVVPAQNFGLLSAVIILFALIADLVLLPAMLVLIRPRLGAAKKA